MRCRSEATFALVRSPQPVTLQVVMDELPSGVGQVFAEAIKLPPGAARAKLVADRCASNQVVRREVESLLRAHDEAGDFLQHPPASSGGLDKFGSATVILGTSVINAAAHADAFLRSSDKPDEIKVEQFVGQLPEAVRREVHERIKAGLRVRQLCAGLPVQQPDRGESAPQLPGFRVERKLGEGGLGFVYAALDEKLNRKVAIKVLRRSDDQVRQRLLDEARKTAALNDTAVVTVYSVLDELDPPAIVMEYVEGFSVDRFTSQLNFEQKARLLRDIAHGLSVAHAHGLVHRDLKPDNVIVGPDMRPRILDFGLALSLEEAARLGRGFEGTPLYASPEQALGKSLTPASDVFSFGSLMFKVLTGKSPFNGKSVNQVLEAIASTWPPFLREVAVGVPQDLQAICLACLEWNPADRPSAETIASDLGRFLVGEPVRLRPKLYNDMLRRAISEHEHQAELWESQNIITREERDALEIEHRRLLADEDHWIIDARRITPLQTVLSAATWLTVVATVLMVWRLRDELQSPWRWMLPALFTSILLLAGSIARKAKENLPAATFLAGAALSMAPTTLSLLAELKWFSSAPEGVTQLFGNVFTNSQVFTASLTALCLSLFGWWRFKMTGFAWTTSILTAATYVSALFVFNWLEQEPEAMALWCLPLVMLENAALTMERAGRVRWTMPFHLIALATAVICMDTIAIHGPTLNMLGVTEEHWAYFDSDRQVAYSFVLNGLLFLAFMLAAERESSLDLRRASKWLEMLAILHVISALFYNALNHRNDQFVNYDVWIYVVFAVCFVALAAVRSRWRMLVGGLVACGMGSYLLVDLQLVPAKPFIIGMGVAALMVAIGAYFYVRRGMRG